ncbi:MAG: MarR family transcriptional regulator [Coriobacteriia bacterium]|nr:MarR family transcriptional regulator [Coriobacteriia bacterium]
MFMSDVSTIMRRMRMFADRSLADQGIGFPEQLVLMHLSAAGTSNQESIAAQFNLDKGAVAKTIAKLEGKGLVTRQVNPDNKREKRVSLTPAAHEVLASMGEVLRDLETTMFQGLTQDEIDVTCASLARIAANLTEGQKE